MQYFSDLVRDTTTTTGTGNITLSGTPPVGFVAFGSASEFAVGDLVSYVINSLGGSEWETGICPLSTSTTLQRSSALARVLCSSNNNNLVNFSAGTKDVRCSPPAYFINNAGTRGRELARMSGAAMN